MKVWCWEDLGPEIHAQSQGIEDAYRATCKDQFGFSTFVGHLWFRRSILHEMAMDHANQLGVDYHLVMHMRPFDTVLRPHYEHAADTRMMLRALLAGGLLGACPDHTYIGSPAILERFLQFGRTEIQTELKEIGWLWQDTSRWDRFSLMDEKIARAKPSCASEVLTFSSMVRRNIPFKKIRVSAEPAERRKALFGVDLVDRLDKEFAFDFFAADTADPDAAVAAKCKAHEFHPLEDCIKALTPLWHEKTRLAADLLPDSWALLQFELCDKYKSSWTVH